MEINIGIVWGVAGCLSFAYTYMYVACTFVCHKFVGFGDEDGYRWAFGSNPNAVRQKFYLSIPINYKVTPGIL